MGRIWKERIGRRRKVGGERQQRSEKGEKRGGHDGRREGDEREEQERFL